MKHTQGEWFVKKDSNDILAMINEESTMIACAYHTNGYIKDKENNYIPCETAMANAKLIAAAPDLLKALDDLLIWHREAIINNGGQPHLENAINAINKATK